MKNEKLENATTSEVIEYVETNLAYMGFCVTGSLFDEIILNASYEGFIVPERLISKSDLDAINKNSFFDFNFYLNKSDIDSHKPSKMFDVVKSHIYELYDYYNAIEVRNNIENLTTFKIHHTNYDIDDISVSSLNKNCFVGENGKNTDVSRIYHAMIKIVREIFSLTTELFKKRKGLKLNNLNYEC